MGAPDTRRATRDTIFVGASGMSIRAADGTTLDDWGGTYFVNNIGTGRAEVARAMAAQSRRMSWISPTDYTDVRLALTTDLQAVLPAGITTPHYTVGGSDAMEAAIRMARKVTRRSKVLTFFQSYHGDTMTVENVCGGVLTPYGDRRPWAVKTPSPYDLWEASGRDWTRACGRALDRLEATLRRHGPRTFACMIIEPVMGSPCGVPIDRPLAHGLREVCDRFGIKLVADEVVTGFGRTGRWFGSQAVGLRPDAVVLAKGLTGGYAPLGAVVFERGWGAELRRTGLNHGLTFAGHPVGCAAARATIGILQRERLVERSAAVGGLLRSGLERLMERHPGVVSDVRGVGLLLAMQIRPAEPGSRRARGRATTAEQRVEAITAYGRSRGLRLLPTGDSRALLFCPPLTVRRARIDRLLEVLDRGLRRV